MKDFFQRVWKVFLCTTLLILLFFVVSYGYKRYDKVVPVTVKKSSDTAGTTPQVIQLETVIAQDIRICEWQDGCVFSGIFFIVNDVKTCVSVPSRLERDGIDITETLAEPTFAGCSYDETMCMFYLVPQEGIEAYHLPFKGEVHLVLLGGSTTDSTPSSISIELVSEREYLSRVIESRELRIIEQIETLEQERILHPLSTKQIEKEIIHLQNELDALEKKMESFMTETI
ncbi:MAG: hypothetical protein V1652_02545 [bacterium]